MPSTTITFHNRRGQRLAGILELAGDGSPGVLLCQGLSGVKHLVLPEVAAGLAAEGISSLRFDYAGFGESEGEQGWIDPAARIDDARFALAVLAAHPAVDRERIGVYGHSYGGPVAICCASREPLARAVVSVSGPGDGTDLLRSAHTSWDWIALRERVAAERAAIAAGAPPTRVGLGEIFPFSPAFLAAYAALSAGGGTTAMSTSASEATYLLTSVDAMADFHPADDARRLGGRPLLMIHGARDDTAPIEDAEALFAEVRGPKQFMAIPDAAHNDLDAGEGLRRAIGAAADWFGEHLG